jgi:hypothetical protein
MKVVRVLYQKVFPLAQYVNEKIGVEIEINTTSEEESSFDAFRRAKDMVEAWHKESSLSASANLISPPLELPVIYKNEEPDKCAIPGILANDILSCNSLVVLDAYKGLIKDNKELFSVYEKRRSQLVGDGGMT